MRYAIASTVILLWVSIGCSANPRVEFTRVEAVRIEETGQLKAVTFSADFEAQGAGIDQLLYEVRLLDQDQRPIRSLDGRYQMADGTVAASRTLLKQSALQRFEGVTVTIPAEQLSIRPEHLPVTALFTVSSVPRQELARARALLPVTDDAEFRSPMDPHTPDERILWFVRDTETNPLPILCGPYATLLDALESVPRAEGTPEPLQVEGYTWFIPVVAPHKWDSVHYVGPCLSEEKAMQVMETLTGTVDSHGLQIGVGVPVRLRLKTGLERRADPAPWLADDFRRQETPPRYDSVETAPPPKARTYRSSTRARWRPTGLIFFSQPDSPDASATDDGR